MRLTSWSISAAFFSVAPAAHPIPPEEYLAAAVLFQVDRADVLAHSVAADHPMGPTEPPNLRCFLRSLLRAASLPPARATVKARLRQRRPRDPRRLRLRVRRDRRGGRRPLPACGSVRSAVGQGAVLTSHRGAHGSRAASARASSSARMRVCSASSRSKRLNTIAATRNANPGTNESSARMANSVSGVCSSPGV